MGDMDAALLDAAHIERLGIDELHNQHAKQILVTEILRNQHLGKTAQQLAQRRSL